jgi:hypothetical protein
MNTAVQVLCIFFNSIVLHVSTVYMMSHQVGCSLAKIRVQEIGTIIYISIYTTVDTTDCIRFSTIYFVTVIDQPRGLMVRASDY